MASKTIHLILFWFFYTSNQFFGAEIGRNFIFAISADHSLTSVGVYNKSFSSINPTPFLDTLASKGIVFRNSFCTSGTFFPILDIEPFEDSRNGKISTGSISKIPLALQLQKLGYQTAFFGYWPSDVKPKELGFEYWEILKESHIFFNPVLKSSTSEVIFEGHSTDVITDRSLNWLEKSDNKSPLFLLISFNGTLRPWMPPIRFINQYDSNLLAIPESFFNSFEDHAPATRYQSINVKSDLQNYNDLFVPIIAKEDVEGPYQSNLDRMNDEQLSAWRIGWSPKNEAFIRKTLVGDSLATWKYQRFAKNYLRCIRAVDYSCERLSDYMISQNKLNSLFIYSANTGRFIGENGWFGKSWMYDQVMRIPLIISDLSSNSLLPLNHEPTFLNTDLSANIMALANNRPMSKKEFSNNLQNSTQELIFFTHFDMNNSENVCPHFGVRTDTFKLIHYFPFDEWEFFSLSNDPLEEKNLYADPVYQTDLLTLKSHLEKFKSSINQKHIDPANFSEDWKRSQRLVENRRR